MNEGDLNDLIALCVKAQDDLRQLDAKEVPYEKLQIRGTFNSIITPLLSGDEVTEELRAATPARDLAVVKKNIRALAGAAVYTAGSSYQSYGPAVTFLKVFFEDWRRRLASEQTPGERKPEEIKELSLVAFFKKNSLQTDVGDFEYISDLGQGGNASVLEFHRDGHSFAIKFLPHEDQGKLRRFRDEYFLAAQIPTHQNVVRCYHFDNRAIGGRMYSLIVMKRYAKTLHKIGPAEQDGPDTWNDHAWKIFDDLCRGLKHLHKNGIVHRDIKPQNIFHDESTNAYVIGDLGIAHFNEEAFAKDAKTRPSDRLSNYLFSAPEQADSRNPVTPAADIYALGQVIQWYLTGRTIRGLGRTPWGDGEIRSDATILDSIVHRALHNEPSGRFQSIEDIEEFIKTSRNRPRDPWIKIHDFDDAIRYAFPRIRSTLVVTNAADINLFLEKFSSIIKPQDFCWIGNDGGNDRVSSLELMDGQNWLLNNYRELCVSSLLIHRSDASIYKNFFVLILDGNSPFPYFTLDGAPVSRAPSSGDDDYADLFDGRLYVDPNETLNGYILHGTKRMAVDTDRFKRRHRILIPSAIMIVPDGTASSTFEGDTPTIAFLAAVLRDKDVGQTDLEQYLEATRSLHDAEYRFNN